ncbi:MAG: hypothetical protein V1703_00825 [Candidatus Altiarchaeota archaeon]
MAFAISVALFASGILIGYSFNAVKVSVVDKQISDLRSDVENVQLEFMYMDTMGEEHACPLLEQESNRLLSKLDRFGEELTNYEESKDLGSDFYELKNTYHFLQIRTWLLQERMKKDCGSDTVTVLYFYSKDCEECKSQGYTITYFKQELKDRLMVFALDTGWQQPMMDAIKSDLNITETPMVVVNSKRYSFLTKEELIGILCGEYNQKPDFCSKT